jgi:hypothetical protein
MAKEKSGEGTRAADRRYRKGVRETTERTTTSERADRARDLKGKDKQAARNAEQRGKAKARS